MKEQIHFIGIGGIGMSALARILLQRGYRVSGSDLADSPIVEGLRREGAQIVIGHFAETIAAPMTVVYNSQVQRENPEFAEALKLNCPLMHRSDLLQKLLQDKEALLVAGTHGKTTTSSLLAHVLTEAGLAPSFAIGGIVHSLSTNGQEGKGRYFVAEADESDGTFLKYAGIGGIITNIDNDHLDYWGTEEKLEESFCQFAKQITLPDLRFLCLDDERIARLKIPGVKYGFHPKADLRILSFRQEGWQTLFDLQFGSFSYNDIALPLIGGHNVLNASAVFGLCLHLRVEEALIRHALKGFKGVGRRAEKKGELGGITIYDDYAHHPTEIFTTLRALKNAIGERRLIVAFQPHRFTRTRECMDLFPEVFDAADELILTDIYAAGESPIEGVTAETLLKKMREKSSLHPHYFPRKTLASGLLDLLEEGDVLVTMGAGDITKLGGEVLQAIAEPHAESHHG